MNKKFWLKKITIDKSPGFSYGAFPPLDELGEHLNIVWGPNGVGKSTLARAMRALIWKYKGSESIEAKGHLIGPDSAWQVTHTQGTLVQTRLSDNQDQPLLGRKDELSESYWFPLHELLQEGESQTSSFLEVVHARMHGGVNLDNAKKHATQNVSSFAKNHNPLVKEAVEKDKAYNDELREQMGHRNLQKKIADLQESIHETENLQKRRDELEIVLQILQEQASVQQSTEELSQFHPSMDKIDKSTHHRLKNLLKVQEEVLSELQGHEKELSSSRNSLQECDLDEEALKDTSREERIRIKLEAYKDALSARDRAEEKLVIAQSNLNQWEKEHAWILASPPEEAALQDAVLNLDDLASQCEPLRCTFAADKILSEELGELEELEYALPDLRETQRNLVTWLTSFLKLQGFNPTQTMSKPLTIVLFLILALISGGSALAGILGQSLFLLLGILLMFSLTLVMVLFRKKNPEYNRMKEDVSHTQELLISSLKKLEWEIPQTWHEPFFHLMYAKTEESIADLLRRQERNARRVRAKTRLDESSRKLDEWQKQWREVSNALGLRTGQASLEGAQFFKVADRLAQWSAFRLAFKEATTLYTTSTEKSAQKLLELQNELGTAVEDLSDLTALAHNLLDRLTKARTLKQSMSSAEKRVGEYQKKYQECQTQIIQFWQEIGLALGDEVGLSDLVADIPTWEELHLKLRTAQQSLVSYKEENPQSYEKAQHYDQETLKAEIEEIRNQQEAAKDLHEELGSQKTIFDSLKTGTVLAEAASAREQALQALDQLRQEQVQALMIHKLADELKQESELRFQPKVVQKASEWLATITNNRHTLTVNDKGFFVTDVLLGENFSLDELSSATRVQLLFAIRMGFISMQEEDHGIAFPIFLDELLANSDDERALAISRAISTIALERQVFYCTAQRDEVEKLQTLARDTVKVISLEDEKRSYMLERFPLRPYVYTQKEAPQPVSDYHEYGNMLGVSGATLWQPIEDLATWYLFTQSEEVYPYLKKGWEKIGNLSLNKEDPSLLIRINLLKRAQELAQQGRCRTLYWQEFSQAELGFRQDTEYWKTFEQLLGDSGMTGNDLLKKKIKRFTEKNVEILSDWLFEHGYATEESSYSQEEILMILSREFASFVQGSIDHEVVARWLDSVLHS